MVDRRVPGVGKQERHCPEPKRDYATDAANIKECPKHKRALVSYEASRGTARRE
jgi:hypothetical protein